MKITNNTFFKYLSPLPQETLASATLYGLDDDSSDTFTR